MSALHEHMLMGKNLRVIQHCRRAGAKRRIQAEQNHGLASLSVSSKNAAGFIEIQPAGARPDARLISITEIAEKIRFDLGAREEFAIHTFVVEPGHGATIQSHRASGNDEITALQTAVAKRSLVNLRFCFLAPGI